MKARLRKTALFSSPNMILVRILVSALQFRLSSFLIELFFRLADDSREQKFLVLETLRSRLLGMQISWVDLKTLMNINLNSLKNLWILSLARYCKSAISICHLDPRPKNEQIRIETRWILVDFHHALFSLRLSNSFQTERWDEWQAVHAFWIWAKSLA